MESQKNIKQEIERYVKYNYSKKDSIAHLLRDGFSEDEIRENITSYFKPSDSNFNNNPLCFGLTLMHLLLIIILSLSYLVAGDNVLLKFLSLGIAILCVAGITGYYKSKKDSILIAMIVISLFGLGCCGFYLSALLNMAINLVAVVKRLPLVLYIWLLYYIVEGNYAFYKNAGD